MSTAFIGCSFLNATCGQAYLNPSIYYHRWLTSFSMGAFLHPVQLLILRLCYIKRFQVDDDRFLRIADNHPLRGSVGRWVDLLVWRKWGNINEVAWLNIFLELHPVTPAYLCMARYDIDDGLRLSMMVNATGDIGRNNRDSCPEALRTS